MDIKLNHFKKAIKNLAEVIAEDKTDIMQSNAMKYVTN
jgi:hypothetical protein